MFLRLTHVVQHCLGFIVSVKTSTTTYRLRCPELLLHALTHTSLCMRHLCFNSGIETARWRYVSYTCIKIAFNIWPIIEISNQNLEVGVGWQWMGNVPSDKEESKLANVAWNRPCLLSWLEGVFCQEAVQLPAFERSLLVAFRHAKPLPPRRDARD